MRLLLFLLLLPSVAAAQVKGITLASKDGTTLSRQQPAAGQMVVGKELVAVFPDSSDNRPNLFKFDGSQSDSVPVVANAAVFAGSQLCIANIQGLHVLDGKLQEVDLVTGKVLRGTKQLLASPDGNTIFALTLDTVPVIVILQRDDAGKFKASQTIAPDENVLAPLRTQYASTGRADLVVVPKGATRVPGMDRPNCIALSRDGKHLFVAAFASNSLLLFERGAKQWEHVQTVFATERGRLLNGLMRPTCIALGADGEIFVGGMKRLSRLNFDGKTITSRKWWIDDSENVALGMDLILPCLESVLSVAVSANGNYLFLASKDTKGIAVIDVSDETLVGTLPDPMMGMALDVAISPDGRKLFAKTTSSQLLVYDLDATFTK